MLRALQSDVAVLQSGVGVLQTDFGVIRQAAAERLSATLAASIADEGKLIELRRSLRCAVATINDAVDSEASTGGAFDDVDSPIEPLLNRGAESGGFKW